MGFAPQLSTTTALTPREQEKKKSAQQRAEDVIYTLNHTFTCLTLTDLLIVPVLRGFGMNIGHTHHAAKGGDGMVWVDTTAPDKIKPNEQGGFKRFNSFCADDACNHTSHSRLPAIPERSGYYIKQSANHSHAGEGMGKRIGAEIKHAISHISWKGAGNWFIGEAVGDVGAAFVTIPVQRYFPGFMDGIRHGVEPVVGGFFHRGAVHAANKWADKNGLAHDAGEVVDRAQQLYDYEMRHLPQMAVWTASSILLHYGVMKGLEKNITIGEFSRQKAAGAGITAALVFGARAFAPDKAHQWDETAGKRVVVPLTKKFGKLFGVEEREVEEHQARQQGDAPPNWKDRVKVSQQPQPEVALRGV